jgi:hypothetical protein
VKRVVSSLHPLSSEEWEYINLSREQDQEPRKKMLPEPDSSLPVVTEQQFTAAKAATEAEQATKALYSLQTRLNDAVKVIAVINAGKASPAAWAQHGEICRKVLRVIERFLDTVEPSR